MNQTGGGQMGGAPTSQPYILTLSNSTTNNITSNIIGKAFANITATAGNGNGIQAGMQYIMGISGTTYVEFLYQQLNKPFIVGLTYVDATSQGQALKTLQLKVRDTNGNAGKNYRTNGRPLPAANRHSGYPSILEMGWLYVFGCGHQCVQLDLLLLPIRKRQPHSRPRGSVSRSRLRQPQCGAPRQGCSRTGCRRCSCTGIIFHKVTRRRRGNFFLAFSYFYSKIANNESLRIYRFQ